MTTKHLEPLSWVAPVLADNAKTHVFIYETGAGSPLPRAVAQHPRVTLRTKPPERDPFFSFFDHAARNSGSGDYTLFVHGHDTHYHRQTPARRLVALCYEAVARATFAYANAGDAVHSTWAGCAHAASRAACVEAPPCASMVALINSSWTATLGALVGDARPPARVAEINGNEALVHRCRLAARPAREWAALRDLTETHHGGLAFALEGSFHRLMGEPWVREGVTDGGLNFVACGPNAVDTLWPGTARPPARSFDARWRGHTELGLRAARGCAWAR